jgi:hypothetical protein
MSQNFQVSYVAGGKIDRLPHPLFPRKKLPHILGRKLTANNIGKFTDTFITTVDSEYLCIAIACSTYTIGDYWDLEIGGKKICETIYTKGLPESIACGNTMVVCYPIPSGTSITLTFTNAFNVEKDVFFNLHFLE